MKVLTACLSMIVALVLVIQVGGEAQTEQESRGRAAEAKRGADLSIIKGGDLDLASRSTTRLKGSYNRAGSAVSFNSALETSDNVVQGKTSGQRTQNRDAQISKQTVARIKVNGKSLGVTRNQRTKTLRRDGNGQVLTMKDKQALAGLANKLGRSLRFSLRELPPQEDLLVRTISYYTEAPVGYRVRDMVVRNSTVTVADESAKYTPGIPVLDSHTCKEAAAKGDFRVAAACTFSDDDGVARLSCASGFKPTSHDAINASPPAAAHCFLTYNTFSGPCQANCQGKCGIGCNPFASTGWTQDCLDHDQCIAQHGGGGGSGNPACGDEYDEAFNDFFASITNQCGRC